VFRDRFGCWGFLELWRSVDEPPFTDTDLGTNVRGDLAALPAPPVVVGNLDQGLVLTVALVPVQVGTHRWVVSR
jgi:hypothetical protein